GLRSARTEVEHRYVLHAERSSSALGSRSAGRSGGISQIGNDSATIFASACCMRLLRSRDAVQRHRAYGFTYESGACDSKEHRIRVLRSGPHDVHREEVAGEASPGRRCVYQRRQIRYEMSVESQESQDRPRTSNEAVASDLMFQLVKQL